MTPEPVKAPPQTARAFFLDPERRGASALVLAASALVAAWITGDADGFAAACLGAWICLLALPAGALPVVVMIEWWDARRPQPETALLGTLRWLLAVMPVAALLAVPVLLQAPSPTPLRPEAGTGSSPAASWVALWFAPGLVSGRLAACFCAWIVLAHRFAHRSGGATAGGGPVGDRRTATGLALYMGVGALVVADLPAVHADPGRVVPTALTMLAAWSSLALSVAILSAPPDIGPARRPLDRSTPLSVLLAIWALLHLLHAPLLWPADAPEAAAWFAPRTGPASRALALYAGFVLALALLLPLKPGANRTRLVAALALVLHVLETFWFVTPSLRGRFALTLTDLLVLAGFLALTVGLAPLGRRLIRRRDADAAHARGRGR